MKTFEYTIIDPVGMHARPAGFLVKEAKAFESAITVTRGEKSADARKLIALMGLGVKKGETITVTVEGTDEEEAAKRLEAFFKENL